MEQFKKFIKIAHCLHPQTQTLLFNIILYQFYPIKITKTPTPLSSTHSPTTPPQISQVQQHNKLTILLINTIIIPIVCPKSICIVRSLCPLIQPYHSPRLMPDFCLQVMGQNLKLIFVVFVLALLPANYGFLDVLGISEK